VLEKCAKVHYLVDVSRQQWAYLSIRQTGRTVGFGLSAEDLMLCVGRRVGFEEGLRIGVRVGFGNGAAVEMKVGFFTGLFEGIGERLEVGLSVGILEGLTVGILEGVLGMVCGE